MIAKFQADQLNQSPINSFLAYVKKDKRRHMAIKLNIEKLLSNGMELLIVVVEGCDTHQTKQCITTISFSNLHA